MQLINFFKTLNSKIDKYDKMFMQTNPFSKPIRITLVWVEDTQPSAKKYE